jgi:hypothetical protein
VGVWISSQLLPEFAVAVPVVARHVQTREENCLRCTWAFSAVGIGKTLEGVIANVKSQVACSTQLREKLFGQRIDCGVVNANV